MPQPRMFPCYSAPGRARPGERVSNAAVGSAKRLVKRTALQVLFHASRALQPARRPRVLVLPSNPPWDPASNLRAWIAAPELRRLGWRVTVVHPALTLPQRLRAIRAEAPAVIFMQQTRHPLNRPWLYAPAPVVLDADDADYLDPACHEVVVRCVSAAAAVVAGSRFVRDCFSRHHPDVSIIWTSTPVPRHGRVVRPRDRPPIVAWGHAAPFSYPEEAALVQRALLHAARQVRFSFWLFGTSAARAKPWFAPLEKAGLRCVAIAPARYDAYLRSVAKAAVGLQPVCLDNEFSRGKSFGKVLAYLAGKVAVIASDAVDHPLFFEDGENGVLVGNTAEEWGEAIRLLITDAGRRERIAERGHADFLERLTTPRFARLLDPVLRRAARAASREC